MYHIGPVVIKFGGTSVSTKERIETIISVVRREKKTSSVVVVVSALSGITDLLLLVNKENRAVLKSLLSQIREKHEKLIATLWKDKKEQEEILTFIDVCLQEVLKLTRRKKKDKALKDKIISYGEIISSYIISNALVSAGIRSVPVKATECIITNDHFGSSDFLVEETKTGVKKILTPLLEKGIIPVVTGFIGKTKSDKTTTLGRGGSDYSASIIGYCLGAREVQIWTDVDGIYTADPRIVKKVQLISTISYKEASELASFGAKVLHPRTLKPVILAKIPLRVLNTCNPTGKGTLVTEHANRNHHISAISHKKRVTLVNIYSLEMLHQKGFLAKVYNILAKNNISVDLVSSSEVSESIVLDNDDQLVEAVEEISQFAKVSIKKDLGMVSLIGEGIVATPQTIKEIFEVLDKENILVKMVSLGAIDINVSLVVKSEEVENAVKALHKKLFKQ